VATTLVVIKEHPGLPIGTIVTLEGDPPRYWNHACAFWIDQSVAEAATDTFAPGSE
jgi:hypothetical protein